MRSFGITSPLRWTLWWTLWWTLLWSLLALLPSLTLAPTLHAQTADVDPPVIRVLESGVDLVDGSLFNRTVTPGVEVTDASAVTVDSLLDGLAFVSGTPVTAQGPHELAVTATDAAGNGSSLTVGFEIDTTPPVFLGVQPADGGLTAAAEVTLTGDVTGADSVTADGQPATLAGGQFTAGPFTLAEGERIWSLVAADAAGNTTTLSHRLVRDASPPVVAISQPLEGAVLSVSATDVVGTVSDAHLEGGGVTVNGTTAPRTAGTFAAPGVPLAEGGNTLTVVATDAAGNTAQVQRTIALDTLPPAVAITDPAAGSVVPDAVLPASGTVSDPHLQRVEVNGLAAAVSGGAWSLGVPLVEGVNDLTVQAFDQLGHSAQATVSVIRDSQAPEIRITSPADASYWSATTVGVSGTVVEEPGLTVTVNGQAATLAKGTFSTPAVPLVEGENRLIARVVDALGNQGAHTRVVYRDTVAPTFLGSEPGVGALAVPPGSRFVLTFSEPLGPLAAGAWTLETAAGVPLAATATVGGLAGEELTLEPAAPLPSKTQIHLTLSALVVDRAGNPLADPGLRLYTVADVEAPPPPVLSATPPAYLCAPSLTLAGSAEAEAVVEVAGGASRAAARAAADGTFTLVVELAPGSLNHLELTARDRDGNLSGSLAVDAVHDCDPPRVVASERIGDQATADLSEPVDPASALAPGVVTLSTGAGPLAGTVTLAAGDSELIFTAGQPLPAEPLRLAVTTGLRDRAGNAMGSPYASIFGGDVTASFLSGRVLDADSGRPLSGARVAVTHSGGVANAEPVPEVVTGADGRLRIPVAAGTHSLSISRGGYTPVLRITAATAGLGADVFDPRLTPAAAPVTVDGSGGSVTGSAEPGGLPPTLDLPVGALAVASEISLTALEEQALPALLPYGWSPRGALWLDLGAGGGGSLLVPATLSLPVAAADGLTLPVVHLDLATLQWWVVAETLVVDGRVEVAVDGGGGYAVVEADAGPPAPPAAGVGSVLGAATAPVGDEVLSATLSFDPSVVLPSQRSQVTASYNLVGEAASGLPLSLSIREELTLLDGTVRSRPPYEADLVLYRDGAGAPRSRFGLRPSEEARSLPLQVGAEDVTVRTYGGGTVSGNVLGPVGGTVADAEGDRVDIAPGTLAEPVAVSLSRRAQTDLPAPVPAGTSFLGLLALDLSGAGLNGSATLSLELGAAPGVGEEGLLFEIVDLGGGPLYRPVGALAATASGWTLAAIDPLDLPWPGVRRAGLYLFARLSAPVGYLRGRVWDVDGSLLAGARLDADSAAWVQLSGEADLEGRYVLPAPVAPLTVTAVHLTSANQTTAASEILAADARVDLDLSLQITGPVLLSVNPPDGSLDVVAGIQPTLTFSEPVDPTTAASGILLYQGASAVAVDLEVLGSLVRILPKATLTPGTAYEIRVNTALRDLQGVRLAAAVTSSFTTRTIPTSDSLDLTRIHLFEPDAAGMAQVLGRSGAVPAGALVFVENTSRFTSTVTVTAGADGSFDLSIQAGLGDTLLLHVLIDGANEILLPLTPFLTADGRGAHVEDQALTFTTLEDLTVRVAAGTFREPAVVRIESQPLTASPAPIPTDFQVLAAFQLDFGGAEATRPLQISLPDPSSIGGGGPFLLARTYRILGEPSWMLYDLMRLDGANLTTEAPAAAAGASSTAGELRSFAAAAQMGDLQEYLPGAANPGLYTVMESTSLLDFVAFPYVAGQFATYQQLGLDGMVAVLDRDVQRLLQHDAVLLPTRRSQSLEIVGRDLSTGYRFFEGTFAAPAPDTLGILPPGTLGDTEAPIPVGGSPLRFLPVVASDGSLEIEPGIRVTFASGQLTVDADDGAVAAGVEVRLLGLDDGVDVSAPVVAGLATTVSSPATAGNRYLIALGAVVEVDEPLVVVFSEMPEPSFANLTVYDWLNRDAGAQIEAVDSMSAVRISPQAGWQAGQTYTLSLGSALADPFGNSWGKLLDVPFRVAASRELGTLALAEVRDVARLGSLLFVAAGADGLMVVDASDPSQPKNLIPDGTTFGLPLGDPVTGVAVDPHGRVLVVGGGVASFGQLKIFDPLALDPLAVAGAPAGDLATRWAAFKGSTVISDPLSGLGTSLPEGTPRRVAVLSDDDLVAWRLDLDPAPTGLTLDPPAPPPEGGEYTLTLSGTGWTPNRPVTLRDRTRGRFQRVDTDAAGAFSLSLAVEAGDRLELVRNRSTVAYVATRGVGIEVVDVDAFYNETPENPTNPDPQSDLLGIYSGFGDPTLLLCDQPVSDIGGAILDLGTLFDSSEGHPHPLTLVGLVGFRGLALFESDPASVGNVSFFHQECLRIGTEAQVAGLLVVEDYPFDLDGNGRVESHEVHDYIVVAHRTQGVLIYDAEDRDQLERVGWIRVPGNPARLEVDRQRRRLFVSAAGAGIYVLDFDQPPAPTTVDANGDSLDDRILETIALPGNTNAPALLVPELGLAWAGGLDRGLTSLAVGAPSLSAVRPTDETAAGAAGLPRFQPLTRLAPLGVPADPKEPSVPASFRVLAALPAGVGATVSLEVAGLGPGGLPVAAAGDPADLPGLPEPVLPAVELRRLASSPWEEGYQLFLSEEVAAVADLRAVRDYVRSAAEGAQCPRCDGGGQGVSAAAREVLSGFEVRIRPAAALAASLAAVYDPAQLDAVEVELASVPWELSPALRQEPTLNPALGTGDVVPGTLLHSGELSLAATDLAVRGRGLDFAFQRTYRSQTAGSGPLGPGWDHLYRQRLRALPNGDVEYYDGRGRRETFERTQSGYDAPPGRFADLVERGGGSGWVLYTRHRQQLFFDGWGRLTTWADAVKDSSDTGNELRFQYDAASRLVTIFDALDRAYHLSYDAGGRLTQVSDFSGRTVSYSYDALGRLEKVTSPKIATGPSPYPSGLTSVYGYADLVPASDLAARLNRRDNVISVTDPKGQLWLSLTYMDKDGDTRADEVSGQSWGGADLSIAYDFTGRTTTVTDRRAKVCTYTLDADGHTLAARDPTLAVTAFTYDADGSMLSRTEPLGRKTTWTYDSATGGRSRGNPTTVTTTPDTRGANGSSATLTTSILWQVSTNRPLRIVDPRGKVSEIDRDAAGLVQEVREAVAQPELRTWRYQYNAFGQPTQIENPNQHVTQLSYFASGSSRGYLERTVVDPSGLGLATRYETDPRGNVTATVDPRGVRHEEVFNEVDWRVEATRAAGPSSDDAPALGYTTTWLYDANGNVTEVRRPFGTDGTTTTSDFYTYGILDELRQTRRQVGVGSPDVVETYDYDANFNPIETVRPSGQVTRTTYDARNLQETVTRGFGTPEAVTESFTYNQDRELTGVTDGRLNLWATTYDGYGRVRERRDPLGNRTVAAYDDNGNRTLAESYEATTDRLLSRTAWTYDLLDRPTATAETLWEYPVGETGVPAGARDLTTLVSYDPVSNVESVTDPEGRVTSYQYDAAERRTEVTDPVGNRLVYDLDPAGNPKGVQTFETTPAGGTVVVSETMGFDALNRQISHTDGLGNRMRYVYDARDLLRVEIDAENYLTVHDYDGLDRRTQTTRPEGISETFDYDPSSRLVGYVDALDHRTSYAYDALDRRTSWTYPDQTTYTVTYDPSHNLATLLDPNGSTTVQTWDAANRMTGRAVTLGTGVVGPTSESYTYDGLNRPTQAVSGTVVTDRVYDSLSRQLSETTAGKSVTTRFDDVGNPVEVTYPSGFKTSRMFDKLDRPEAISGQAVGSAAVEAVRYGYRGPFLLAQTTYGNGLSGGRQFDGARRMTSESKSRADGLKVFQESLSWSPRSLKVAQSRGDANGVGQLWTYDGAKRLLRSGNTALPTAQAPNNTLADPTAVAALPEAFQYSYDAAQNLISRTRKGAAVPETIALPVDTSGRNRPAAIGGVALSYDANGNLKGKGDLQLQYDFRNRLTRVTDALGGEVASYTYDAFNRRVEKLVGAEVRETSWNAWQPVEETVGGQLYQRRTYGVGLDEIVEISTDLDADGLLEPPLVPLYDSSGHLAVVTDTNGKPVERYLYSPYGALTIQIDSTPPRVEQVRVVGGEVWVEVSEEVLGSALEASRSAGGVTLVETSTLTGHELAADQPVTDGRQAWRRIVLSPAAPGPTAGTEVTLSLAAEALVDPFLNQPATAFELTFPWPATDVVLFDDTAPEVTRVLLQGGFLEVELTEEPDLATMSSLSLDGTAPTWTLKPDRYTLRTSTALAAGSHQLTVGVGLTDLQGLPLAAEQTHSFNVSAQVPNWNIHREPDPREAAKSTVGNTFGFQGHPRDAETGLLYLRNRYYDPELGRFITPDPMGYVDGPSMYGFAGYSPVNFGDPRGLELDFSHATDLEPIVKRLRARSTKIDATLKMYEGENKPDLLFERRDELPPDHDGSETLQEFKATPKNDWQACCYEDMMKEDKRWKEKHAEAKARKGDKWEGKEDLEQPPIFLATRPKNKGLDSTRFVAPETLKVRYGKVIVSARHNRPGSVEEAYNLIHELGHAAHAASNPWEYFTLSANDNIFKEFDVEHEVWANPIPHDQREVERKADHYREEVGRELGVQDVGDEKSWFTTLKRIGFRR